MSLLVEVQEATPAGRRPYLTLGIVAASHSAVHMYAALMPIIFPQAMARFGFNYAQLGLMLGLGNGLSSLMQGIYGFLTRRVNAAGDPRRRKHCVGGKHVPDGAGRRDRLLFCVQCHGPGELQPAAPGGEFTVSESFGKKLRGTAFAINFAGGNAGTVFIPFLGTLAVAALGWRGSLSLFAAFGRPDLPAVNSRTEEGWRRNRCRKRRGEVR